MAMVSLKINNAGLHIDDELTIPLMFAKLPVDFRVLTQKPI